MERFREDFITNAQRPALVLFVTSPLTRLLEDRPGAPGARPAVRALLEDVSRADLPLLYVMSNCYSVDPTELTVVKDVYRDMLGIEPRDWIDVNSKPIHGFPLVMNNLVEQMVTRIRAELRGPLMESLPSRWAGEFKGKSVCRAPRPCIRLLTSRAAAGWLSQRLDTINWMSVGKVIAIVGTVIGIAKSMPSRR